MRVAHTADPREESDVVERRSFFLGHAQQLPEPHGELCLSQHVLDWLAETEIDDERQPRHQFGEVDAR